MPQRSYFAAANGFSGFRSYFEDVFNPKDFLRLYVIKGGPGTGKSSMMKKIGKHFSTQGYEIEAIFCSSDPNSLDGIIINSKNGKIGVLDGTAPHETDAKIPGAVDEIINLGNSWNKNLLVENREKIIKLNEEKKRHYKNAYEYLKFAGMFFDTSIRCIKEAYVKNDAQLINDIIFDIPHLNSSRKNSKRLFSAFGKNGYSRLDIVHAQGKKQLSIMGSYGSEYIFMSRLVREIESRGASFIRFISPFSEKLTEGILLPDTQTFIAVNSDFSEKRDTSLFLDESILTSNKEKLNYYSKEFEEALSHAKKEFSAASDSHFKLEKIYTSAMNFNEIDDMLEKITVQIEDLIK